jgi:Fe-S-cluster containining protein
MKNGPFEGKLTRFVTSLVLPVDPSRTGECIRCGACCKFLVKCPFLRPSEDDPGSFKCRAYFLRPPQCRKYPRTKSEQIHHPCGYRFGDDVGARAPGAEEERSGR